MAFIQLAARRASRDAVQSLAAVPGRLYHWGLKNAARSTVADADNSRPVGFFRDLYAEMYGLRRKPRTTSSASGPDCSASMPASSSCACPFFPGPRSARPGGGIKIPVLLDHGRHIPAFAAITDARTHESGIAKAFELPKGSIVVFDRGYINHAWFRELGLKKLSFVTRLRRKAVFKLLERRLVDRASGVASDHSIEVPHMGKQLRLCRIGYRDPESGNHNEFLTNHFGLCARTLADIYKERWQIELFFKKMKQNLRIRSLVATSENAVMILIFTALTIFLLHAYQKFLSCSGLSVQQLFQLIQLNLLGKTPLELLPNPRRRKNVNSYDLSILDMVA